MVEQKLLKEEGKRAEKELRFSLMLKKKFRLNVKNKIRFTNSFNLPLFTLRTVNNKLLYNRYQVIISKKIDKRAVVRNKLKRIFFRCFEKLDNAKQGFDLLFILKKESLTHEENKICSIVKEVLQKEGFIK